MHAWRSAVYSYAALEWELFRVCVVVVNDLLPITIMCVQLNELLGVYVVIFHMN